jgi:hypothetical protein
MLWCGTPCGPDPPAPGRLGAGVAAGNAGILAPVDIAFLLLVGEPADVGQRPGHGFDVLQDHLAARRTEEVRVFLTGDEDCMIGRALQVIEERSEPKPRARENAHPGETGVDDFGRIGRYEDGDPPVMPRRPYRRRRATRDDP